jgi:hypothetical protein
MVRSIIVALVACAIAPRPAQSQVATPAIVGHWKGNAEIFSNWTTARTLAVDIRISSDDKVTGTIGDARLVDGRLVSNRSGFERVVGIKTDYRIVAGLDGKVIAAEGIDRATVSLPFNAVDSAIMGSVQTSGTKMGGPTNGILTAGRMVLRKAPDSMVCPQPPASCPCPMMSGKPPQETR